MAEPGHYNYLITDVESVRKPDRQGGHVSIEAPLRFGLSRLRLALPSRSGLRTRLDLCG